MAIIFILIVLALLFDSAGGRKTYDQEAELFISKFIVEYTRRSGTVMTREAAIDVIRAIWKADGERLLCELREEEQEGKARELAVLLCAEAERKAARRC